MLRREKSLAGLLGSGDLKDPFDGRMIGEGLHPWIKEVKDICPKGFQAGRTFFGRSEEDVVDAAPAIVRILVTGAAVSLPDNEPQILERPPKRFQSFDEAEIFVCLSLSLIAVAACVEVPGKDGGIIGGRVFRGEGRQFFSLHLSCGSEFRIHVRGEEIDIDGVFAVTNTNPRVECTFGSEFVRKHAELFLGAPSAVGDVMRFDDRVSTDNRESGIESPHLFGGFRTLIHVELISPCLLNFGKDDRARFDFENFIQSDDVEFRKNLTELAGAVVIISTGIEELRDAREELNVVTQNAEFIRVLH